MKFLYSILLFLAVCAMGQGLVLPRPLPPLPPIAVKVSVVDGPKMIVEGADKQKVGETAATIRRFRPPEPYKGKGIRYVDEKVILKEGKSAG